MQAFRDPCPGLRLHAVRKFTDDAQPQTVPPALRAVSTVEAHENLVQLGLAHALAVVSDRKSKGVHGHGHGRGIGVRQRIVGLALGDLDQVVEILVFELAIGQGRNRRLMHATEVASVAGIAPAPGLGRALQQQH